MFNLIFKNIPNDVKLTFSEMHACKFTEKKLPYDNLIAVHLL